MIVCFSNHFHFYPSSLTSVHSISDEETMLRRCYTGFGVYANLWSQNGDSGNIPVDTCNTSRSTPHRSNRVFHAMWPLCSTSSWPIQLHPSQPIDSLDCWSPLLSLIAVRAPSPLFIIDEKHVEVEDVGPLPRFNFRFAYLSGRKHRGGQMQPL